MPSCFFLRFCWGRGTGLASGFAATAGGRLKRCGAMCAMCAVGSPSWWFCQPSLIVDRCGSQRCRSGRSFFYGTDEHGAGGSNAAVAHGQALELGGVFFLALFFRNGRRPVEMPTKARLLRGPALAACKTLGIPRHPSSQAKARRHLCALVAWSTQEAHNLNINRVVAKKRQENRCGTS